MTPLAQDVSSTLSAWLNAVAGRPWRGSHVAQCLELLDTPCPFDRDQYVPGHFTASGIVTNTDRTHLLLIHHSKLKLWLQPGGHFERTDSSLWTAACREVSEETGLALEQLQQPPQPGLFDLDIHDIPARGNAVAHRHYDLRVLILAPLESLKAGSDAEAARWVPMKELAALDTDQSVLRCAEKLRDVQFRFDP